jgi:hypothetical protein
MRSGGWPQKNVYIRRETNKAKELPHSLKPEVSDSISSLVDDAYKSTVDKYRNAGREVAEYDLTRYMYRETRNSVHFGKPIYDDYIGGNYQMCPCLDPDLQKLKLSSGECNDGNLLMALIYIRYGKGILDFPVQGGRTIDPETIAYAESINSRYPYEYKRISKNDEKTTKVADNNTVLSTRPLIEEQQIFDKLEDMFYSYEIKDTINRLYGKKLYKHICYAINNTEFHKYVMANAGIAIYLADRAVQESNSTGTDKYEDAISSLFSLKPIAQSKRYRPKNNTYRKVLRALERKLFK